MANHLALEEISKEYPLADSKFKTNLLAIAFRYKEQEKAERHHGDIDKAMSIQNALYLVLKKYIGTLEVTDDHDYLNHIIKSVKNAQHEFSQVCYASPAADAVFKSYLMLAVLELASLHQ
jgi:hypothetical protein